LFELIKSKPNLLQTFVPNNNSTPVNHKTLAFLELKVPDDPKVKSKYRWQKSVKMLHNLIQEYQMAEFSMV